MWGGRAGREGSSGGITMELTLAINFNQFKTYFLGIKLHYPFNSRSRSASAWATTSDAPGPRLVRAPPGAGPGGSQLQPETVTSGCTRGRGPWGEPACDPALQRVLPTRRRRRRSCLYPFTDGQTEALRCYGGHTSLSCRQWIPVPPWTHSWDTKQVVYMGSSPPQPPPHGRAEPSAAGQVAEPRGPLRWRGGF